MNEIKMTFILLFVAVSCSVPYSTTKTTCDIIWMTDQGNEIARYKKSTINMTHISHNQSSGSHLEGQKESYQEG